MREADPLSLGRWRFPVLGMPRTAPKASPMSDELWLAAFVALLVGGWFGFTTIVRALAIGAGLVIVASLSQSRIVRATVVMAFVAMVGWTGHSL